MSTLRCSCVVALLFVLLASLPVPLLANEEQPKPPDMPETPVARYFVETGYWVPPAFAAFWEQNGGLMTFGYPISRAFYQDGLHRQFFERAIFEHHSHLSWPEWEVQLVRLGALNTIERRRDDPAFRPSNAEPYGARFFPETGHTLDDIFLDYWSEQGGLPSFGYPLSSELIEPSREDGVPRRVQYFERARFEHHPEHAGTPFEVLLGHLGHEALAAREVPPLAVTPQPPTIVERDAPPVGPLPLGEPSAVGCGFNLAFYSDIAREAINQHYLDLAAASGCEWLRLQFLWSDLEQWPGQPLEARLWPYARIISRARDSGLRLLVNVTHAPAWALPADPNLTADPDAFAAFLNRLVTRFAGQVDAWQVWNEPNLPNSPKPLGRVADPEGFFHLLKAAYPAIKTADPDALVVFPGLAPTSLMIPDYAVSDSWFLESLLEMNNGEVGRYFDVFGMQGYGAGNHPDTYFPGNRARNPGWIDAHEFYFRHVEALRTLLVNAGMADVPVWITETGWPAGKADFVYGYSEWITPDMQAEYLVRAFEIMRTEWHWVEQAFVWHLNAAEFGDAAVNPFAPFSITTADGVPRPAYYALTKAFETWRDDVP